MSPNTVSLAHKVKAVITVQYATVVLNFKVKMLRQAALEKNREMVLSSKGDVLTGFSCLSALISPPPVTAGC